MYKKAQKVRPRASATTRTQVKAYRAERDRIVQTSPVDRERSEPHSWARNLQSTSATFRANCSTRATASFTGIWIQQT